MSLATNTMPPPPSLFNCASTRVMCLLSNSNSNPIPSVTVSFRVTRTVTSSPNLRRLRRVGSLRTIAQLEDLEDEDEDEEEVDWENQILEDTVPLVGYVRNILHIQYKNGEKLSPKHEKTICEMLLPYHPDYEEKIGPGIDYITVGLHPDFERSRCLFVVRKDGKMMDFSYWKCIKGLIRKKYPLHAERFIYRHFQPRRETMY